MILHRPPKATLRPFVSMLWAKYASPPAERGPARELVLPIGAMHIVFRLGDRPLRLFEGPDDPNGQIVGASVVGGVRNAAYCKDTSEPASAVGIMLRPGAADLLSRTLAGALAGRHTCLDDIWGQLDLAEMRDV